MLAVKRDTLALVAYFDKPPQAAVGLIKSAQELASGILGNIAIKTWACSRDEESKHAVKRRESITDFAALTARSVPAHRLRYFAWNEPPDRNKYKKQYGVIEYDWDIDYHPIPVMYEPLPPYLRMDFVVGRFPDEEIGRISEAAIQYAQLVAAQPEFCSGLFDVGDLYEISYGQEYSGTGSGWVNAQRQIARYCWIRAGAERMHMARGVFWGNLYGPKMVAALGGAEFIREYRELEKREKGLCVELPRGSLLVLLKRNCRSLMHPPSTVVWQERAAWLHKRLLAAGLHC